MNQYILSLLSMIVLLVLFLVLLGFRLFKVLWRNAREPQTPPRRGEDLLVEVLREKVKGEQETALAYESLNRLHRTMLQHIPAGLLVLGRDGTIQYGNDRGLALLGETDPTGLDLSTVLAPLGQAFETLRGEPERPEIQIQLPASGQIQNWAVNLSELPEHRFLLVLQDKTKLRLLEEQLAFGREMELVGEMASGIAHEFKNALAVIQGHAQMLSFGDVEENSDKILKEVDRLLHSLRLFLRSSKAEAADLHPLSLSTWLAGQRGYWNDHPQARQVRITIAEPAETQAARVTAADPLMLSLLLNNLINNGLDACQANQPEAPWVRVRLREEAESTLLEVEDRGPGFAADIRDKLFVPFVTTKPNGTGLGLFYCRKIMMAHGGRLELAPDLPTRILCRFPVRS